MGVHYPVHYPVHYLMGGLRLMDRQFSFAPGNMNSLSISHPVHYLNQTPNGHPNGQQKSHKTSYLTPCPLSFFQFLKKIKEENIGVLRAQKRRPNGQGIIDRGIRAPQPQH